MPCLNEEEGLNACVPKIQAAFAAAGVSGEIVVCDNGSSDASVAVAQRLGACVVHQPRRGYGWAYQKGFASARGQYLIMGDADDTYDFSLIPTFLDKLRGENYDFVTGSRYTGGNAGTNIVFWHRFLGNPLLTGLLNRLFGTRYTDVYCGFRGFSRQAYDRIRPVSTGMEYNLELAINAGLAGLRIAEVPIRLHPRLGTSKLRTLRDGWRSLRMMLLYSPNTLFLWPGATLLSAGLLLHAVLLLGLLTFGGRPAGAVSGVMATILSVVGFQTVSLGLHAKTYSWSRRFDRQNAALERFYERFTLESGLLVGGALVGVGTLLLVRQIVAWLRASLLPLPHPEWASFAATLIILGFGTIFSSLFISAMSLPHPGSGAAQQTAGDDVSPPQNPEARP